MRKTSPSSEGKRKGKMERLPGRREGTFQRDCLFKKVAYQERENAFWRRRGPKPTERKKKSIPLNRRTEKTGGRG